jgi:hypothetical protein
MVFSRSLSWLPVRWPTCPRSSASRLPGHTACGFLWRHICRVVVVLIVHEDPPVAVRARVRGSSIQRSMLPAFQVAISKLRFSMFFDVSVPRLNQFEERRSIRHRGLLFSRDPAQPSAFLRKKLMPACQSLLRSSVARLLKRPAKMQSAFGTTRADRLGGFCSGGFPQPRRMVFAFRRGEYQCPETNEDIRLSIVQWNKQKLLSGHNGWLTSNKEMRSWRSSTWGSMNSRRKATRISLP